MVGIMQEFSSPLIVDDIISDAMSSANAGMRLKSVRGQLADMFARNQFNTARAVNAFSTAIHWAVWDHVRGLPDGRTLYRNFKRTRVARSMAEELAAQFKIEVGAYDQRRPRGLLRFLLGP
jgi:hypothetical protein